MQDNKCKFVLEGGKCCGAYAIRNEDYCFNHHPSWQEKKHLAVVKGGSARQVEVKSALQKIELNTPKDIILLLSATIGEVRSGEVDPRIGSAIGYLAGQLIKAYEVAELNDKAEQVKDIIAQMVEARKKENAYGRQR